jgi:site-specific DNA-methyltransferase (adenine-specific)
MNVKLINDDCLNAMAQMEDNSVDAIVTDPPYGISFMWKAWDKWVPSVDIWKEALRVLKPGGYLLAFAGTRTQHRMAVNIEDAGFEIRDMIAWLYGSWFPKSHSIWKAITATETTGWSSPRDLRKARQWEDYEPTGQIDYKKWRAFSSENETDNTETELTENGQKWNGWWTALKPALEPITVARKPLEESTVAKNVLKYGTGGINIDDCRVWNESVSVHNAPKGTFAGGEANRWSDTSSYSSHVWRWPANVIHDGSEEVVELFPKTKSSKWKFKKEEYKEWDGVTNFNRWDYEGRWDEGSNARFFYCAKASKKDRNEGCELLTKEVKLMNFWWELDWSGNKINIWNNKNFHPTVKPTDLMRYLCRLVTQKGGTVLDPFMWSGSTGKAAVLEWYNFIGIDLSPEYVEIAKERINNANKNDVE